MNYQRRPLSDDLSPDDLRAEIDRLNRIIERALDRWDRVQERATWSTAWAMQSDLREAFLPKTAGDYPDGY